VRALKEMMLDHQFGKAGDEVVIEEYLEGDELSILTFSDDGSVNLIHNLLWRNTRRRIAAHTTSIGALVAIEEEAQKALKEMMLDHQFGKAGDEVVIEEYLEGDAE
jgi:phosphoribosylamine-glycine ligase